VSSVDEAGRSLVLTPGATGADGIAEMSRLVVRALGSARGRVDVLSLVDPPGFAMGDHGAPGVRCIGAGGRKSRFVAAALRARLEGPRRRVVCLHLHLGAVARLVAGRGAPLATVLVGIEAWSPLRRGARGAVRRSDALVAISAHTARRFRSANPEFEARPIDVCTLAVRERDGAGSAGPGGGASGAPRGGPFALIVGRMAAAERYKGHDLLIDLWPRVAAAVPGATLVIAGDGDDRARLETRAAACGGPVRFVGRVSDTALADLYRECAFFAMPSRDEGFGLVFLEAMRAGKACVGGMGAAAEVIADGVTGLVVEPDRPADVLAALLRLFREPDTRARMGRAGAVRVAREFTEAQFRRRFRALLGLPPEVA